MFLLTSLMKQLINQSKMQQLNLDGLGLDGLGLDWLGLAIDESTRPEAKASADSD